MTGTEPDVRTRGARTRSALIDAAQVRFAALGYEGALGADIAADAGVSEPSIGFHFGSKRGLFVAVMEAYYENTMAEIDAVIDLGLDPMARLAAFTRWWIEHLAAHRSLIAEFEHQARPGRAGDDVAEAYSRLQGRFVRHWIRMIDQLKTIGFLRTDVDSRVILSMFIGATRQVVGVEVDSAAAPDDYHIRQLLELVLSGVRARSDPTETPNDALVTAGLAAVNQKLDRLLRRVDAIESPQTTNN